jgi:multiple sugar transport system permease protein
MNSRETNRWGRRLVEAYRALGRQSLATTSGRRRAGNAFTYALAIALGISMLVPFLWMISTSLMDEFEVFQFPPRLVPSDPVWSNYPNALTAVPFGRFFLNSAVMSLFIVSGHLITASTAGYAFARLRFPGRDKVFILFLANLMVPIIVLLIPRFLLVNALGWVDTYAGLIVTELVGVWGIFLMRQYFLSIPRELEDAARIDGANEWHVFWRVALPLAKPAIATVALFSFVETWKSFLWPLIVTRSMAMRPVEVGIAAFHSLYFSNWPYQMAAAVTAVIPILILFLFTQRYFVQGIQLAGLKY